MKQKILLDCTALFDQYSSRGIGIYTKELYKRLIPLLCENLEVALCGFDDLSSNLKRLDLDTLNYEIEFFSFGEAFDSTPLNLFRWGDTYLKAIKVSRPDIFFAPHFERGLPTVPRFSKLLKSKIKGYTLPKTVVMVHDVTPIKHDKFSSRNFLIDRLKKIFYLKMFEGVKYADLVLTNSKFSASEISQYTNIDTSKIMVTYLGVNESFREIKKFQSKEFENPDLNNLNLEKQRFFLYDSGLEPNKNVEFMLSFFKKILEVSGHKSQMPNNLVVVGGALKLGRGNEIKANDILGQEFLNLVVKNKLANKIVATGRISEVDLLKLYSMAAAHLNFSTNEGFNLGPVQAMSAGILSVTADASVNPEVTGGKALLVDVTDVDKATEQFLKTYQDEKLRNSMVSKAKEFSEKYSWESCAKLTYGYISKL